MSKGNIAKQFICQFCQFPLGSNYSLKRHLERNHREKGAHLYVTRSRKIHCPMCPCVVSLQRDLATHLIVGHELDLKTDQLEFQSRSAFFDWKREVEKCTVSSFVKKCGDKKVKNFTLSYYHCHRSGYYIPKSKHIRNLKKQGTSKLNRECPAKMVVMFMDDGPVKVTFHRTHVGHDKDVNHLKLTPEERQELAYKIAKKVPYDTILEEVKILSQTKPSKYRLALLTRQDLHNIEKAFNLSSVAVRSEKQLNDDQMQLFEVGIEENCADQKDFNNELCTTPAITIDGGQVIDEQDEKEDEFLTNIVPDVYRTSDENDSLEDGRQNLRIKFENIMKEMRFEQIDVIDKALDYILTTIQAVNANNIEIHEHINPHNVSIQIGCEKLNLVQVDKQQVVALPNKKSIRIISQQKKDCVSLTKD